MKEYYDVLTKNPLFKNISNKDLTSILECLNSIARSFYKGEFIFHAGDKAARVGIVLEGNAQVIKEDFNGDKTIISDIEAGDLFAEAYACAQVDELPISVLAVKNCRILFISYKKIMTTCTSACAFHRILIENMLSIVARKNIMLDQKIEHVTKRTTREKLISYLFSEMDKNKCGTFAIPFDRQQLADYLSVDRSAMCAELGKMKREGMIEYKKNRFTVNV